MNWETKRIPSGVLIVAATLSLFFNGWAATKPTLAELKVSGAQQSSYLHQKPRALSHAVPEADLDRFRDEVSPILQRHCIPCHGPDKTKGHLRIDSLDPDLLTGGDVDWWLEVMAVLGNEEMPPPEESELSGEGRAKVIEWLSNEVQMASRVRRAEGGHSSFRRMTRYEYNYALQDLLGLERNFARDLPPEAHSEDGFQNSSETLQMSVTQLETYRRLARKALMRATVRGPQPAMLYWGVTMEQAAEIEWKKQDRRLSELTEKFKDQPEELGKEVEQLRASFKGPHDRTYFKDRVSGRTAPHTWGYGGARYAFKPSESRPEVPERFDQVAILPQGRNQTLIVELGEQLPDEGILRVRVRAARGGVVDDRIPSLRLEFGWQASNEGRARLPVSKEDIPVTAHPGNPEFYEWNVALGDIYPRNSVRKTSPLGSMPNPSEYIRFVNSAASSGEIQIDYVEVSTPVHEVWPPLSHRLIFFESPNRDDESVYAREVVARFMRRAWRRSVSPDEIDQKMRLLDASRVYCETFEEAVIEVLATVLSAPDFLYLVRDEGSEERLSDVELATRLAAFLWCSVPDERLLHLAERGQLSEGEALRDEVRRLLEDPRSGRFSTHFVRQWLDMQLLDFKAFDRRYDPMLKTAMQQEPVFVFREVLRQNGSVIDFIHANYTMANERLAQHYGFSSVLGNHFRRVSLDRDTSRGGLLTQAGLLAMNSSGEDSNPLKRGIWMLESLLNDPPPPPPPAVPEIDLADPEIAKMTLKERMEDHRNHPACISCHEKIDPWGIALEHYDAMGRWRGEIDGKPVDATSRLFNNEVLDGMDGLKRYLLMHRQDQFVRAMVHKMVVYALGRPLTFSDRSGVEAITAHVRQQGDGLVTLIMAVVTSELFRSK